MSAATVSKKNDGTTLKGARWWAEVGWRHIVAILTIAYCIVPLLYVLSVSLNPGATLTGSNSLFSSISLENYGALGSGKYAMYWSWILNSLIVSSATAVGTVLMGAAAAYAFSRFRFKGRRGGLLALLLIMMFPAILSMIALYNMISDVGQILPGIGLNTLNGYCLALMGGSLGQVWLIKGTFDTIPRELDEAAIIDGCTHWQVFRIILLPTLKPILATTFLLSFVGIISDFLLGSILLTDNSKKTLAVGLYGLLSGDRSNNLGLFAAGAVLTMIPVIALFQYLQKYIVGGATAGAVKG